MVEAFERLDLDDTGTITKSEAMQFYQHFSSSERMSVTTAFLKATAEMMVKEFDSRADENQEIDFDSWAEFFVKLEIPDQV